MRQRSLGSYTAFANGCIPRAAVCGGGECQNTGRQKAHKYLCYLKTEKSSDLTTFLGAAQLVSVFANVLEPLATLSSSTALDAFNCRLVLIALPSLL